MRILIIKLRYLGDLILTLPLINVINHYIPGAKIDILTKKRYEGVIDAYNVNASPMYLDDGLNPGNVYQVLLRLRLKKYDFVFDLNGRIDGFLLCWLARATIKAGFNHYSLLVYEIVRLIYDVMFDREYCISESIQNCNFLTLLGLDRLDMESITRQFILFPKTVFLKSRLDKFMNLNGCIIGVHPFASRKTKIWPHDNFVNLAKMILTEFPKTTILLLGNEHDCEAAKRMLRKIDDLRIVDLTGETSIKDVVCIIDKLDLFIGNDSGLMHAADSLNKKIIALFGPTCYLRWGPINRQATIVSKAVLCSPCSLRHCNSMECMKAISIEDVMREVRKNID